MRLIVFSISLSFCIVVTLVLGATEAPWNPFSSSEDRTLYDIRFPASEITRLKLDHAIEAPRYDVSLFGNSRSEMVGRAELRLSECRFFNHSGSGESIRNSLGLLEYLAARGKAPRLALISFDHMELAMIANPASLPFGAKWKFALKDLTFAAVAEMSLKDTVRLAARYARGIWRSVTSAFSSGWLLEAARGTLRGDLAPSPVLPGTTKGYRSDGSFFTRAERTVSPPTFKPATGDEFIDALLKNDLVRLKALEGRGKNGVEKIVIYESPLAPPFDKRYAVAPRLRIAAHRKAYSNACRSLGLTCLAAPPPGAIEPDKKAWRDATHPPLMGLARYLWRLIKNTGVCDVMAESPSKSKRAPAP
jgi:hypothetical protein